MLDMYTHIIAFLAPKSNGKLGGGEPPLVMPVGAAELPFLPVGAAELPFLPVGVRPTGLSHRSASRKQDGQDGSRAREAEPAQRSRDVKPAMLSRARKIKIRATRRGGAPF